MVADDYNFWLFDPDGTLIDAEWSYMCDMFDRVGDRLGRQFTDRETETIWHGLGGMCDPMLHEWDIDPAKFWPAFHREGDPVKRAEVTYLHGDAERLIEEIRAAGRPVGIVAHCQQFLAGPVLDHLDVRDWFDTVVCCTEETGWKPDAAPARRAIGGLGLDGRLLTDGDTAGMLAGDDESDIEAAWNAGLDGIHVERHGPEHRGRCAFGEYRVESFDDLVRSG